VTCRVTTERGVEVVIPPGFDAGRVPSLVGQWGPWIERAQLRLRAGEGRRQRRQEQLIAAGLEGADGVPQRVVLAAVGEEWLVVRPAGPAAPATGAGRMVVPAAEAAGAVRLRVGEDGRLRLTGGTYDPEACRQALRRWMSRRGQAVLVPWLGAVAEETGLQAGPVCIRGQRTRWGSCGRDGTISLNRGLLLLPPALVRYVLVHELCHTVHHDHSARFWRLVARHEPDHRRLRAELREARRQLPEWVMGPAG